VIDAHLAALAAIGDIPPLYVLGPIGAVTALVMALVFSRSVMKTSEGDDEMVRIAEAVRQGAMAYLVRQYKVVAVVFVALVIFLAILAFGLGLQPVLSIIGVPIAGLLSGLCGWFGMKMATNASARTANAAKESLNDGLRIAFRSGAVMGMVVVGFALLDISIWFLVLNAFGDKLGVPVISVVGEQQYLNYGVMTTIMLSFGMGASTQALFARVGGGIYTKAADVGADLVGKVEAGIPEDDARNPATIADNVGDNVGDVAGMGADLYESYYGSILATMALGAAAAYTVAEGVVAAKLALLLATAPIALAGVGILCSIVGVFSVRAQEGATFAQLLAGLHRGVYLASALIIVAAFGLLYFMLGMNPDGLNNMQLAAGVPGPIGIAGSIASGLIAGLVIAYATEYYTSYEHEPTRRIARQAITGPATVIIAGIAEGMKSTWASLLTVTIAIIAAFTFSGGSDNFLFGLYGVGIAAVGMLATLGITLATDAYGPIADNAGGNAEMTGQPPHVRERTDMLDSLGNTTAATGKGFAIGSAALTALALFAAYIMVVQTQISTQATSWVQKLTYEAPAEAHAVYEGHGKFAIVVPQAGAETYYDGAMIDRNRVSADTIRAIPVGTVFTNLTEPERFGAAPASDAALAEGEASHRPTLEYILSHAKALDISGRITEGGPVVSLEIIPARRSDMQDVLAFYDVTLLNPRVLGGLFMGVLLAFLFCAMTMNAVGRAANGMMLECRRQFAKMREAFHKQGMSAEDIADPMKWPKQVDYEGVHYPDYARCVSISTAGAQKEMVLPALLAITVPIAVGLVFSVPGVMGLLAGGLTSGFAVAIFMANAGGAWDNAKKLLESYGKITADEFLDDSAKRQIVPHQLHDDIDNRATALREAGKGSKVVYGKGSDDHKATVVGDTVGDPFKDTSGPSLNILIKLISIVSVVFAGLVVKFGPVIGSFIGLD
jgi:H(+)-translocating pyrophosphatase